MRYAHAKALSGVAAQTCIDGNTIFLTHLNSEPAELAGGFAAPAKVRLVPEVLLKVRDSLSLVQR